MYALSGGATEEGLKSALSEISVTVHGKDQVEPSVALVQVIDQSPFDQRPPHFSSYSPKFLPDLDPGLESQL